MPRRRPVTLGLAPLLACVAGCASDYRADNRDVSDSFAYLRVTGPDAALDVRCQLGSTFEFTSGPRLEADVGRCQVFEDDDGLSRLDYPLGPPPADPPHAALSIALSSPPQADGQLDLIRRSDKPHALSHADDPFANLFLVPEFVARPLEVMPDRLAAALTGTDPVPPAVTELARDLVDCPAVAVAGGFRGLGLFACRMSLTDAGRAKLRAALARHDSATRPAVAAGSGLRTDGR